MKTPYCTALKLASRAVDDIRSAISEAQEEIASLDGRAAVLRAVVASERLCRSAELRAPETGWFSNIRAKQQAIARRRGALEAELVPLREEASVRLTAMRGLEDARERYRTERARTRDRSEQALADDRAATLFRQFAAPRPAEERR